VATRHSVRGRREPADRAGHAGRRPRRAALRDSARPHPGRPDHRPPRRHERQRHEPGVLHPGPGGLSAHRSGGARADDHGPQRRHRLVLAEHRLPGSQGSGPDGSQGPELPGAARAHLVGRAGHQGLRGGQGGHRRHLVPHHRHHRGGRRAPGGPARVRDQPAGHRADHRLPAADHGPVQDRRPGQGGGAVRRGAGDRHRDRQGPVRVGQPGPHPGHRHLRTVFRRDHVRAVRLPAHQLDRDRPGRRPAAVRPRHQRDLQGGPAERQRGLAARREAVQLPDGAGRHLLVPAPHHAAGREHGEHLRRRRGATAERGAVPGHPAGPGHQRDEGHAQAGLHSPGLVGRGQPGQHAGAGRRPGPGRMGQPAVHLASSPRTGRCCWTASSRSGTSHTGSSPRTGPAIRRTDPRSRRG